MKTAGHQIISDYAAHCDGVYECRNVRQLEHFIRCGATSNMLTKLFKISSADVTLKRRLFAGTSPRAARSASVSLSVSSKGETVYPSAPAAFRTSQKL